MLPSQGAIKPVLQSDLRIGPSRHIMLRKNTAFINMEPKRQGLDIICTNRERGDDPPLDTVPHPFKVLIKKKMLPYNITHEK